MANLAERLADAVMKTIETEGRINRDDLIQACAGVLAMEKQPDTIGEPSIGGTWFDECADLDAAYARAVTGNWWQALRDLAEKAQERVLDRPVVANPDGTGDIRPLNYKHVTIGDVAGFLLDGTGWQNATWTAPAAADGDRVARVDVPISENAHLEGFVDASARALVKAAGWALCIEYPDGTGRPISFAEAEQLGAPRGQLLRLVSDGTVLDLGFGVCIKRMP